MSLENHKKDWDDLATLDPLWAILTDKDRKFGKWNLNEFFSTGVDEIEKIMKITEELRYPAGRDTALDFGCGVGRLTRVLAKNFSQCYGMDISEIMIAKAKELSAIQNCKFILNTREDLQLFGNNYFDFIYTNLVLQHLPHEKMIKSYISEFIRTLKKDGLLIFQLPSHIPFIHRLQARRRAYEMLRKFGINGNSLYYKLGLNPIRMNFIPEKKVIEFVNQIGGKILQVRQENMGHVQSRTYFVTK